MNEENRLIGISWKDNRQISNNLNLVLNKNFGCLLLSECLLTSLLIIGDYYIFDSPKLIVFLNERSGISQRLLRALMDNSAHCFVGVLSWFIISYSKVDLCELILAGIIASFIDLDHFISAKSFKLIDAISLSNRPFLHNSLTLFVSNILLLVVLSLLNTSKKYKWSLLVFISWFSHHVRDGNRHGLWLGSIYTTKAIKDDWYLLIMVFTPLLIRHFYQNEKNLVDFLFLKINNNNQLKLTHIV